MRRNYFAHRKDKIHDPTVNELERDGHTSAHSAAGAGGGFPDLVVGTAAGFTVVGDPSACRLLAQALRAQNLPGVVIHDGANLIIELKSSLRADQQNTGSKTRERQETWRRRWRGQQAKTFSLLETLALFGRRPSPLLLQEVNPPSCPQIAQQPKSTKPRRRSPRSSSSENK